MPGVRRTPFARRRPGQPSPPIERFAVGVDRRIRISVPVVFTAPRVPERRAGQQRRRERHATIRPELRRSSFPATAAAAGHRRSSCPMSAHLDSVGSRSSAGADCRRRQSRSRHGESPPTRQDGRPSGDRVHGARQGRDCRRRVRAVRAFTTLSRTATIPGVDTRSPETVTDDGGNVNAVADARAPRSTASHYTSSIGSPPGLDLGDANASVRPGSGWLRQLAAHAAARRPLSRAGADGHRGVGGGRRRPRSSSPRPRSSPRPDRRTAVVRPPSATTRVTTRRGGGRSRCRSIRAHTSSTTTRPRDLRCRA